MINACLLKENGYREFPVPISMPYANRLFQKRFRNDKGSTRYFINFNEYADDGKHRYEVSLQFERDDYMMNITIFRINDNMSIKDIEREVYAIWYGLDCKYYDNEKWDD